MVKRRLRSAEWFGGDGMNAFMHRSWMKNQALPADVFDDRPVIGICNTWSELDQRRKTWKPPAPPMLTGYQRLYFDHVLQAHEGADLDFLVGRRGAAVGQYSP